MPNRQAMSRTTATVGAALTAVALAATSPRVTAQALALDHLIQGATATFTHQNGTPDNVAMLALGFGGTGAGIPLDANAVFDLFPPTLLFAFDVVPPNGTNEFSLTLPSSTPLVELSAQVVEASLFAPTLDWRASNTVTATVAPISTLSDEFVGTALDSVWTVLHPELGSVTVGNGELVLTPSAGGLPDMWFDDGEGLAVLRTVTGNFDMRCEVLVHAAGNPGSPPPTGYRLGGLLLRDATATAPGTHEWCHVATGAGGAGQTTGVERKETHASSSTWSFTAGPSTHRELRLVRIGNTVTAWHRDVGATNWLQLATYTFVSLPATVQVGAMCYSFSSPPQVTARFQRIEFVD